MVSAQRAVTHVRGNLERIETCLEVGDQLEGVGGDVEGVGGEVQNVPHVVGVALETLVPELLHFSPHQTCLQESIF